MIEIIGRHNNKFVEIGLEVNQFSGIKSPRINEQRDQSLTCLLEATVNQNNVHQQTSKAWFKKPSTQIDDKNH